MNKLVMIKTLMDKPFWDSWTGFLAQIILFTVIGYLAALAVCGLIF